MCRLTAEENMNCQNNFFQGKYSSYIAPLDALPTEKNKCLVKMSVPVTSVCGRQIIKRCKNLNVRNTLTERYRHNTVNGWWCQWNSWRTPSDMWEIALENHLYLMQQKTRSLCQEPFWIRSSTNMFNNHSLLLLKSNFFSRFPSKMYHRLGSFKIVPVSAFFVRGFCSSKKKKKNRFFWCYPNETLSPFPWRQSQSCQVSTLSKILWGVFCNCQRHIFKRHIASFKRWSFHFWWIQPVCESFLSKHTAPLCQRMPMCRLLNK